MEAYKIETKKHKKHGQSHLGEASVAHNYRLDRNKVVEMLNEALATEIVCVLRYRHHYQVAKGGKGIPIANEFLEHSNEELAHVDLLAERISQLGGSPDFDPKGMLDRSHASYSDNRSDQPNLAQIIEEDLIAERVAIETYNEMIRFVGDKDSTTRRMLEDILAQEEEHADELISSMKWCQTIGVNEENYNETLQ